MIESKLDTTDEKILKLLWNDGRLSLKELGEAVHLSAPAVKSRLERLVKLGVLLHYTVRLDCPAYGYKHHLLVELQIETGKSARFLAFLQAKHYHVERCYQTTGKQAYFLDAYFRSETEVQDFLKDMEQFGTCDIKVVLRDVLLTEARS